MRQRLIENIGNNHKLSFAKKKRKFQEDLGSEKNKKREKVKNEIFFSSRRKPNREAHWIEVDEYLMMND